VDEEEKIRVSLDGFEDALIAYLASAFRFSGEFLQNVPLIVGRHLFVQDAPEVDQLKRDADAAGQEFDVAREPTISVFTQPNDALTPSISRGGRHEWQLRIVIRLGVVLEECKARAEELIKFLTISSRGARMDRYVVKAVNLTARPTAFQTAAGEQAYCEMELKFFAVPRPV
jgi:hypothetical protein